MTTVPPSINPALPQMLAAAATSAAPTATAVKLPPALANLTVGTRFQGIATPGPDPRVAILATAAGDLTLRSPTPLPAGATLTLEVVQTTPSQIGVRLLAINGIPVQQGALSQSSQSLTPDIPTTTQPASSPLPTAPGTPQPLPPGTIWWPGGAQQITALPQISGFVVAAPQASTPQLADAPSAQSPAATPPVASTTIVLPNGADIAVRVRGIALPNSGTATPSPASPVSVPTPVTPESEPAPAAAQQSLPPAPLSTGPTATNVNLNALAQDMAETIDDLTDAPEDAVAAQIPATPSAPTITVADLTDAAETVASVDTAPGLVLPTNTGWPTAAPAPPASVQTTPPLANMQGTVIAVDDGVPVVQLGDTTVQLNVRANLPVGTQMSLEVRAVQPPVVPAPAAPQPPPALMPLSLAQPSWPALSDSLVLLQRADPAAAALLASAIPDGGPQTAAAMISFVQAMRLGDGRQWPGDTTLRALEATGPRGAHLAATLASEVEDLGRQVRDPVQEWRALPIPWHTEGRIERVRVVLRETDPDAAAEKRKGGGGVRFLVDLALSRLGPLQLDGIFRKDTRQLDMMIRTKTALPDAMRHDLNGIFANSNAAMNLTGSLAFQVVRVFPDPAAAPASADKSGLWV